MKKYWEQLKPLERRWAVAGGSLLFLMLNYFFIWPHRHDWAHDDQRLQTAGDKIATYKTEIAKKSTYQIRLRQLQADGSEVVADDQAIDFVHFYSSRMLINHVLLLNGGTLTTRTNAFFSEQQLGINVQANETNLVSFLYSLAAGNSMVRVRAMSLHPNPDHHEINAGITMVASYKKNVTTPAKSGPPVTPVKNVTNTPKAAPAQVNKPPPPANTGRTPVPPPGKTVAPTNKMSHFLKPGGSNNPPRLNSQ